jgi:hypothetical protein
LVSRVGQRRLEREPGPLREPATAKPAAKLAPAIPIVPTDAAVRRTTDLVCSLKITIGHPWRRA